MSILSQARNAEFGVSGGCRKRWFAACDWRFDIPPVANRQSYKLFGVL